MYHNVSAKSVKVAVMHSLSNENGTVQWVFATQTLIMGVNCQNIHEIVFRGLYSMCLQSYLHCGEQ